jgi:hypothetical protein
VWCGANVGGQHRIEKSGTFRSEFVKLAMAMSFSCCLLLVVIAYGMAEGSSASTEDLPIVEAWVLVHCVGGSTRMHLTA